MAAVGAIGEAGDAVGNGDPNLAFGEGVALPFHFEAGAGTGFGNGLSCCFDHEM